MNLIFSYSTKNDCYQNNVRKIDSRYTTFQTRGPIGLMLHSVGCSQPSAKVFADQWNRAGLDVAVHAVVQADGTVYQCLPWNYRGWHAGGSANDTHVGIELSEPAEIKYTSGASFTVTDLVAARAQAVGAYMTAVELFAELCQQYHLDPAKDIISHAEGHKRGIASAHGDPEHLWRGLGLSYTMDTFRAAVAEQIRKANEPNKKEEPQMTRNEILAALGDRYIRTFTDLPEWAKPEIRPLLDRGFIRGTSAEDPDDIGMMLSDIRAIIVCARMLEAQREDSRSLTEFMNDVKQAARSLLERESSQNA